MALFESNTSTVKGGEMTIISRATTIKGDIKLECNIYVAGKVEGNIESTALITVGENGQVIGSMKAKKIIISGLLNGKIETDELELISGGKVQGDATASMFNKLNKKGKMDKSAPPSMVWGKMRIKGLDMVGIRRQSYTLYNVYPYRIDQVGLDNSNVDSIANVTVSFKYTHYERKIVGVLDNINDMMSEKVLGLFA